MAGILSSPFFFLFHSKEIKHQIKRNKVLFRSDADKIQTINPLPIHIEIVMRYAGLTDEPEKRKREHGNPSDFRIIQQFISEAAARQWVRRMLAQGCDDDTGGKGWKYGYTFSSRH